jgi:hypothetical protein
MIWQRYDDLGKPVKRLVDARFERGIFLCMKSHDPIILDVYKSYGSAAKLAKELGITRQCVCQWQKIPLKHVRTIARYTGLSPAVLRPDVYAEI